MRTETNAISRVALGWMIFGEWRARPGRVLLAALAIAVGVTLGFAVHLINASALNEFAQAVRTVNGDADLQVHSVTPAGFDETLYPKLARLSGIATASPVFEIRALASAGKPSFMLLGIDIFRAQAATPNLLPSRSTQEENSDPFDPRDVFLSRALLDELGKGPGEDIEISAGGHSVNFAIAGTLPGVAEGQRVAVLDIAAAQWRFGGVGVLQRIDLKLEEGAESSRLSETIAALLPPDAELVSRASEARRTDSLSRAYRVNLDMLALMALLTGAFLAYSAQALSVARRRAQFALLRVLGMRKRAILIQVLVEGSIVGLAGTCLGLGLGLVLAKTALRVLGGDLGSGYFSGTNPELIFAPGAALIFAGLGILAAVLGSVLPARDAARAQPAIALKDAGDITPARSARKPYVALALLASGAAMAFLPALAALPLFGYFAIALVLAGGVASMPFLARLLLQPLQRFAFRVPFHLASKHLWGAPSQAAIALCGIVASTSLMIAMATMVTSFRGSVDDWLVQVLPADLYIRADGEDVFTPDIQTVLAAIPGVGSIHFRKITPLRLVPNQPPVAWMALDIDREAPANSLPFIGTLHPVPEGAIPVYVSEPAMFLYDARAGDWIDLPISARSASSDSSAAAPRFFVAGIWRDYGRQQGTIAMAETDYTRLTGDRLRSDASVGLAPGADMEAVTAGLRAALPPAIGARVSIAPSRDLRALSLRIFDRSFAVTYLLEAIAILVGLAGVAATFSAQTLARAKEFGMLRHIGVRRGEVIAMLASEGALLGAVGVVAGIGLGIAISQILIHVINPQSFHWTMETRLPLALFGGVSFALIAAASGTALVAGRRALSSEAVLAVREDW